MTNFVQYSKPGRLSSWSETSEFGTNWDDLRFPAIAVNPPGAASDPDVDPNDGGLLFAAATTELIFVFAQMPHSWKQGTNLHPHVHWTKTTSAAGDVAWKCEYQLAILGAAFSGSWTSLGIVTIPETADDDTANQHILTEFSVLDMSAVASVSAMIKFRISRIGGDAGDDYGADAKLLEFDIHYEIDSLGSEEEYTK